MVDLSVKIGSLTLKNPVLTASGCFGIGREYGELYDLSLLGGIVTKTVTLEPRSGNPPPRIWETAAGMLNSIGLANPGVDVFIKEEIPFIKKLDCACIVSVAGKSITEFAAVVGKLDPKKGIDGFELNVSCPNVDSGMAFGTDTVIVAKLVETVRAITKKPLWVKLTPNVTDIVSVARAAINSGADAITAINTLQAMAVDIETGKPQIGNVLSGLSGPAILPVALAKVYLLRQALPETSIIGVGGIANPGDAIAHMIVGANAVQIGSGQFPYPRLPLDVIETVADYCSDREYISASEITNSLKTG